MNLRWREPSVRPFGEKRKPLVGVGPLLEVYPSDVLVVGIETDGIHLSCLRIATVFALVTDRRCAIGLALVARLRGNLGPTCGCQLKV